VVDIILEQPAAPAFIARKLAQTFLAPSPSASLVNRVATALRASGWELTAALQTIFTSNEFKVAGARNTVVKSPAEFVAGALRALGRTENSAYQNGLAWMAAAGQSLYDPPNVGGWPSNDGWLGAGQLLARYNAASALADLHVNALVVPGQPHATAADADGWGAVFGMTELTSATRGALALYLDRTAAETQQVRDAGMITLVVASPEFSLA
jgi:uncharacterized protein (DUF1800 family)